MSTIFVWTKSNFTLLNIKNSKEKKIGYFDMYDVKQLFFVYDQTAAHLCLHNQVIIKKNYAR